MKKLDRLRNQAAWLWFAAAMTVLLLFAQVLLLPLLIGILAAIVVRSSRLALPLSVMAALVAAIVLVYWYPGQTLGSHGQDGLLCIWTALIFGTLMYLGMRSVHAFREGKQAQHNDGEVSSESALSDELSS